MVQYTDLRTLRAFLAVAREGHVTKAAVKLHVTQPAVSLQIKRLAQATGLNLFRRTALGVELTREGTLLAAKAEQIMIALADFERSAGHLANRLRGTLRVGTIIDPEFTRLGAFLKSFHDNSSGVETVLRHGMSGDVIARLGHGEIDVGFVLGEGEDYLSSSPGRGETKLFWKKELAGLVYRIVAPSSLRTLVRSADWESLFALPWIGTPPQSAHARLCGKLCRELGLRQNVVARVDHEASILSMVRAGIGLGLCRESMALHEAQSHGIAIADGLKIPTVLNFVCLAQRRNEPIIAAAIEAINHVWG